MIIFDSTGIEDVQLDAPGVSGSATIDGNLTLHGTTRVMRVPVSVALSSDGQFSVNGEVTLGIPTLGLSG